MTRGAIRSSSQRRSAVGELRRLSSSEAGAPAAAFSIDGRLFQFSAPIGLGFCVGAYVKLLSDGGELYLGQILSVAAERQGLAVGATEDEVIQLAGRIGLPFACGTGRILRRICDTNELAKVTNRDAFRRATVAIADAATVASYLRVEPQTANLRIGRALDVAGQVPIAISARGFDRHSFICGQSGSGKTFATGVILEQLLLQTTLRVIIIDPNSDFVRLDRFLKRKLANQKRATRLSKVDYERLRRRHAQVVEQLRILSPSRDSRDQIWLHFNDLDNREQAALCHMDPIVDRLEYQLFQDTLQTLKACSFNEIRARLRNAISPGVPNVVARIENLGIGAWDVWCSVEEKSVTNWLDDELRCLVADVGGYASAEQRCAVACAILGALWRRRALKRPTLIVIDEAHNICPECAGSPIEALATEHVVRIAAEGRKYGLYLFVATQRPSKIAGNVMSLCDNVIVMKMGSQSDVDVLGRQLSHVPRPLLDRVTEFEMGEALLAGKIVPSATVIKFDGRLTEEGGSDVAPDWANA